MKKLLLLPLILGLLLSACSKRDWVKSDVNELVGFKFFLFINMNGNSRTASGDAVIMPNESFKIRVYDNLLNQHVFDFVSFSSGVNELIVPSQNEVYQKKDPELSFILTSAVYLLFSGNQGEELKKIKYIDAALENNKIKYIILSYIGKQIKIEVLKRLDNGNPQRFKIEEGLSSILFDIVEFNRQDFLIDKKGYQLINNIPGDGFLDWIGELDGQG